MNKQLIEFNAVDISEESVVKETFEKLERVIVLAEEEMEKFSQKDIDAYFDKNNYFEESIDGINPDELTESYEKELTKKLNVYSCTSAPGISEKESLFLLLREAQEKIEELFGCRRAYRFITFMATFLFACISVGGLYYLAQHSTFIKENALYIFGIYNCVTASLFFTVYATMALRYKREIKKIILKCKEFVKNFLVTYRSLAEDFEANLNLMADIACLRDFLDRKKSAEAECEIRKDKLEWHIRKTRDIIDNISHFNDFIKGTNPEKENEEVTPNQYENDAEHTTFYQVKLF